MIAAGALHIITMILALACVMRGVRALSLGSGFQGNDFFKDKRCLYAAVSMLTTTSVVFLMIASYWLAKDYGERLPTRVNLQWWAYHSCVKFGIFAFLNDTLKRVKQWRGAIEKYGTNRRTV